MKRALPTIVVAMLAAGLWLTGATARSSPELEVARPPLVYDFFSYYRPNAVYAAARLRAGDLPLWNPHQQLGGPFLATLQTGVLYPPNALHLALPSQRAFAWLAAAHLALAAAGALALARACGAGPTGAATAGMLHAGSLQLWSSMWTPPTLYTAAWMPVVLAAALRAVERPSPGRAAGFGLALALQVLAGWPYTVAMTALVGAALAGAACAARAVRERRLPAAALAALAGGALVAAGLAAPQLGPALELLARSARAPGTLDPVTAGAELATHDPGSVLRRLLANGTSAAVPGLAAPVLALAAVALGGRGRGRAAVLLLAGLTALGASFPGHLPVYDALSGLPLLGDFRFPFRYRLVTSLALAVCAGVGVSRLAARTRRARRVAAALCAVAVLVEAAPMLRFHGDPLRRFPRREATAPDLLGPLLAVVGQPEHAASRSVWLGFGADRLGQAAGIRVLQDLEPLSLATTSRFVQFLGTGDAGVVTGDPGVVRPVFGAPYAGTPVLPATPERAALLDLLAIRFAALTRPPAWLEAAWRPVPAGPSTPRLFENPRALPRVWRAARAEAEPPDPQAALERLLAPGFDLRTRVLLDPPLAALAAGAAAADPGAAGWSRIERDDPEHVAVHTGGREAGVLVLADAWYPGWQVTVDGAPAESLRVDTALRGVQVPAGESVVEWRYRPRSFRLGVLAAAASGIGLAGVLLGARRRARHGIERARVRPGGGASRHPASSPPPGAVC